MYRIVPVCADPRRCLFAHSRCTPAIHARPPPALRLAPTDQLPARSPRTRNWQSITASGIIWPSRDSRDQTMCLCRVTFSAHPSTPQKCLAALRMQQIESRNKNLADGFQQPLIHHYHARINEASYPCLPIPISPHAMPTLSPWLAHSINLESRPPRNLPGPALSYRVGVACDNRLVRDSVLCCPILDTTPSCLLRRQILRSY